MAVHVEMFLRDQAGKLADQGRALLAGMQKSDAYITLDWDALVAIIQPYLEHIYTDAGHDAYKDLKSGPFDKVNEKAAQYAKDRAAELVGKKWIDGQLVDNPNSEWAITDTTRDELNALVNEAIDSGMTPDELANRIEDVIDDPARADTIAETELSMAQTSGSMAGWRESGVVQGKQWLLSGDHDSDDECDDNADAGVIDLDEDFPSGDDGPPAHPHCDCDVVAIVDDGEEAA